jgi:NADH:ubiquinone reductase (H+-translocating)
MHVVVVGGGFAGVKAALELSKRQVGKITLISDVPYFLHHATLYATATGKNESESVVPLNDIFMDYPDVTVVQDKVTAFEPTRTLVIGENGQYHYDALVLALGSVTTYFNINGMAEHAYGIKSLQEIRHFHDHIHDEIVHKQLDKEYFVIGAGPTGVELAGALQEHLDYLKKVNRLKTRATQVTLVEAAPQILPRMSKTAAGKVMSRLQRMGIKVLTNHKVEGLTDTAITIDGKPIETTTAVWTSGVANNPFFKANAQHFDLAPNGRVNVSPYLEALQNVYVIGDSNTVKYSGVSWPAMKQATFVAKDVARKITKRHRPTFKPHSVPSGLPVGENWGYVEWLGVYVAGRLGASVRRKMELYGYKQLMPRKLAVSAWRAHDIAEVDA